MRHRSAWKSLPDLSPSVVPSSEEAGAKDGKKVRRMVTVKSDELMRVPTATRAIFVLPRLCMLLPSCDLLQVSGGSSEHVHIYKGASLEACLLCTSHPNISLWKIKRKKIKKLLGYASSFLPLFHASPLNVDWSSRAQRFRRLNSILPSVEGKKKHIYCH